MHRYGQGVEEDIKQAVEYYQKGCDCGESRIRLQLHHEGLLQVIISGDPLAHISMAYCYAQGKGVESSLERAFENYMEASKSSRSCCGVLES